MLLRLRGGASPEPLVPSSSAARLGSGSRPGDGASCGGGSRRPYRWWANRRAVAENAVWGARVLPWGSRVARACDDERRWQNRDQAWAAACEEWRFGESIRAAVREAMREKRAQLRVEARAEKVAKSLAAAEAAWLFGRSALQADLKKLRRENSDLEAGTWFWRVFQPADPEERAAQPRERKQLHAATGDGTCGGTQAWRARLRARRRSTVAARKAAIT